jgi:LmbE family N-acetylglucosaminyl deacetylase
LPARVIICTPHTVYALSVAADNDRRDLQLGKRLTVVSPHLDDAVLSLGAAIARAVRGGSSVSVLTVFAGDEASTAPVGDWGRRCGFSTLGEEYRARREEDRKAVGELGASTEHLPLDGDADDDEILSRLGPTLGNSDAVLIPGSPCTQAEHARVAGLLLRREPAARVGLYVDQPYAMWRVLGTPPISGSRAGNLLRLALRTSSAKRLQIPQPPPALSGIVPAIDWMRLPGSRHDRRAKTRAISHYRSQLRGFGRATVRGVLLYESVAGGETVGWIEHP